ncbi:MAG: glycosyltransferase [Proteobacteria bacterium]|nr:glycosyltransferase [Pseudomonadota bacterium]
MVSTGAGSDAGTNEERLPWPGVGVWRTPDDASFKEKALRSITGIFREALRKRRTVGAADKTIKAVVIDPALLMEDGHNYSAMLRVKAELEKLGVEHACLASLTADAAVRSIAAPVLPTKGLWWRSAYTHLEFAEHARAMADHLSLALNDQERPSDLLVLPCCDSVQIRAVAEYYGQRSSIPAPHLLIWLLFRPNHLKPTDDPAAAVQIDEYREAFAALKQAIGDDAKIAVYCETAALAAVYKDIIGLEVGVAPCPNLTESGGKASPSTRRAAAKIVALGHANQAKGYHLLPGAVRHVLKSDDDATFFIHGTLQNSDIVDGAAVFGVLSDMGPRVVARNDVLTSKDYQSRLREADLLLLPYDRKIYEARGSGLFNEAREIGIPVIATRGCAFARPAFDEGWGIEIVEWSSAGIAQAILDALDRLPNLSACAAKSARRFHARNVSTLLPEIVGKIRPKDRALRATAVKRGPKTPLLPKAFFSEVYLEDGTSLQGKVPAGKRSSIRSITGKLVETPSTRYCYSVLLGADTKRTRKLSVAGYVLAEIAIEVVSGSVGVAWVDENYQVIDGTERFAPAMADIQHLVVPVLARKVHKLVFRNFTLGDLPASFRILDLRAKTLTPI